MKRKEFLQSACTIGICSCAGMTFFAGNDLFAKSNNAAAGEDDWKMPFMQRRFGKLVEILNDNVDEETRKKIFENLGRECAKESKDFYEKFAGNPEGFLEEVKKSWADEAIYDKEKNSITVIGKKTGKCGCPLVDKAFMPKDFCNCSIGWNKQAYGTVLGKNVDVKILKSALYGDELCSSVIEVI